MGKALDKAKAIEAAVRDYRNDPNLSYRQAGELHGVSHQSVIDHDTGKKSFAADYHITEQKLTTVEETLLVKHSREMWEIGFPLTVANLNSFANEILRNRNADESVGVNWHESFFRRHKEVKPMYSRPIEKQRMMSENPDSFIDWFRRFQRIRAKWGIVDPDIYNMDESGTSLGMEQVSKVIIPREEKQAFTKKDGNREWATIIECIRAIGRSQVPPFLIVKGKHVLIDLAELIGQKVPPYTGVKLAVSDNGWSTNELGLVWLQHFDQYTKQKSIGAYRLLLLDGHGSHATLAFTEYAKDNNIVLLFLPPHSTHRLQPLDVGIFGPLSTYYSQLVKDYSRYEGRGVTKREWVEWILLARQEASIDSNVTSAWATTGLVPFNPDRVLSTLKIVKEYTSRPTTAEGDANQSPSTTPSRDTNQSNKTFPHVTIQQGTITLDLPIRQADHAKHWIDRLTTDTPRVDHYKHHLKAFIEWEISEKVVIESENKKLREAMANRKKRTKKTIPLLVIDNDSFDEYKALKVKQKGRKMRQQSQPKPTNKKTRKQRRRPVLDDAEDSTSLEGINLPIEVAEEVENEECEVNAQLTVELRATLGSTRPIRERQLPKKYR